MNRAKIKALILSLIVLTLTTLIVCTSIVFYLYNSGWFEWSKASVFVAGDYLKIDFSIAKKDKEKVNLFSKNLGISTEWSKGMGFEVDRESLDKIRSILPAEVFLNIEEKRLEFRTSSLNFLSSGVAGERIEFATGSGRLEARINNDRDFFIYIEEPKDLITHATSSGEINISMTKLNGLFPLADKVAKMDLLVKDGEIKGSINLK